MSEPVPLARFAFAFGRIAEIYDRERPEYAAEAIERAFEALELSHDARVVDLAAGTGKLTRRLAERVAHVVAVEPDDGMRAVLEATTPAAAVLNGTAESIPVADASADAVFVGDAFHWFEGEAALGEIARVLRPRSGLALLWNQWWQVEPALPEAATSILQELYERTGRALLFGDTDAWPAAFEGSRFEPLRKEEFRRELTLTPAQVVALYSTVSGLASLDHAEREDVERRLGELLEGSYRLPVKTELHWTRLR